MICVSIGRTRHRMMIAEHRRLAELGARLVELRLDWLGRPPDLVRLLTDRPTHAVVTCRRQADRGRWRGSENQRLALLRAAIVAGVEYVDLEEDIAGSIPRYGETQRIVSYHNFEETPGDLNAIHSRLRRCDPDAIKIVTMANSPADMVRMLKLVADSDFPTIGFCMGELGTASRILCGKYGSPFTYASFSAERTLAPGQVSFDEMQRKYHYDRINAETSIYGVVGDPIAQSMSPLIHNAAFEHDGLNAVYLPFRILRGRLPGTLQDFDSLNVDGYSVTIPHKEAAVRFAERADELSRDVGAANTLYRCEGVWHACNTDYQAALDAIRSGLAEGDKRITGKRALVLGAGGAARAVTLALLREGADVTLSNRTADKAADLAAELVCKHIKWENRGSEYADILVNCTPVGMFPERIDETPFAENWLREGMLVFDTVYNPENTLLLKLARTRNCRTVSGIEMFIRQAAAQYELFTERTAPLEVMREALRKAISAVRT